jgi:hypothetical protein
MFHRSVADNIRVGRPEATEAEVRRAAQLAHAAEFIERLPAGYETLVGERGVKLSGGQRQRMAIARTILKDAPILTLDLRATQWIVLSRTQLLGKQQRGTFTSSDNVLHGSVGTYGKRAESGDLDRNSRETKPRLGKKFEIAEMFTNWDVGSKQCGVYRPTPIFYRINVERVYTHESGA